MKLSLSISSRPNHPVRAVSWVPWIIFVMCWVFEGKSTGRGLYEMSIFGIAHRKYFSPVLFKYQKRKSEVRNANNKRHLTSEIKENDRCDRASDERNKKIKNKHVDSERQSNFPGSFGCFFFISVHEEISFDFRPVASLLRPSYLTQLYDIGHKKTSQKADRSSLFSNRKLKIKNPLGGGLYSSSYRHRRKRCHC